MKEMLPMSVILEAYVYADREIFQYCKDVYEKHPCRKNFEDMRYWRMALSDSIDEYNAHIQSIRGGKR